MTLLSDALRWVLPEVPGCPQSIAIDAIRTALRDLCSYADVWQEYLSEIHAELGQSVYALKAPDGANVFRLHSVTFNSRALCQGDLRHLHYWHSTGAQNGPPENWLTDDRNLTIWPAPDSVGLIHVFASLVPARDATETNDFLIEHYREALEAGALWHLLLMRQSWGDANRAAIYAQTFQRKLGAARVEAVGGFRSGATRVTIPAF